MASIENFNDFQVYINAQLKLAKSNFEEHFEKYKVENPIHAREVLRMIKSKIDLFRKNKEKDLDEATQKKLNSMVAKCELAELTFLLKTHNRCIHSVDFNDLLGHFKNTSEDWDFYSTLVTFFEEFLQHRYFHLSKLSLDALKVFIEKVQEGRIKMDALTDDETEDHVFCLKYCYNHYEANYLFELINYYSRVYEKEIPDNIHCDIIELDMVSSNILKRFHPVGYDLEDTTTLPLRVSDYDSAEILSKQLLKTQENFKQSYAGYRKRFDHLNRNKTKFQQYHSFNFKKEDYEDFCIGLSYKKGRVYQILSTFTEDKNLQPKLVKRANDIWTQSLNDLKTRSPYDNYGYKAQLLNQLNCGTQEYLDLKMKLMESSDEDKSSNAQKLEKLKKIARNRISLGEEYADFLASFGQEKSNGQNLLEHALDMVKCCKEILKDSDLAMQHSVKAAKFLKRFPETKEYFFKLFFVKVNPEKQSIEELTKIIIDSNKI